MTGPREHRIERPRYPLLAERLPLSGSSDEDVDLHLRQILEEDGNPNFNLGSFTTNSVADIPLELFIATLPKNLVNQHEYPGLTNLWNVQTSAKNEKPTGTATSGSSEGIMLGCLALKQRWKSRQQRQGRDATRPNIVMSSIAHVACLKFARYFDVEARILPVTAEGGFVLDPEAMKQALDENTIGVIAVLGSTFTGHYEPVARICQALDEVQAATGIDVGVHVDAAGGGLVAPFADSDAGIWDFRLDRVQSINVSSHKYGNVPAALGWIIWRDHACLPEDLIFEVDYLDHVQQTYTLSFSRSGAHVALQYHHFLRQGFEGSRRITEQCLREARRLSRTLEATWMFTCVSDIHRSSALGRNADRDMEDSSGRYTAGLPVVAVTLAEPFRAAYPTVHLKTVSQYLRAKGYSIPYYTVPLQGAELGVLRMVIRPGTGPDLIEQLVGALCTAMRQLGVQLPVGQKDSGRDNSPLFESESICT